MAGNYSGKQLLRLKTRFFDRFPVMTVRAIGFTPISTLTRCLQEFPHSFLIVHPGKTVVIVCKSDEESKEWMGKLSAQISRISSNNDKIAGMLQNFCPVVNPRGAL